jgi:hypothetical protein
MKFTRSFAAVLASVFVMDLAAVDVATAANKAKQTVRDRMTAEQKKELRRRAREWCTKKYIHGTAYIDRVQIQSDGRVICYYRE